MTDLERLVASFGAAVLLVAGVYIFQTLRSGGLVWPRDLWRLLTILAVGAAGVAVLALPHPIPAIALPITALVAAVWVLRRSPRTRAERVLGWALLAFAASAALNFAIRMILFEG